MLLVTYPVIFSELFEHLSVHGMEVPASVLDTVNKGSSRSSTNSSPVATGQVSRWLTRLVAVGYIEATVIIVIVM